MYSDRVCASGAAFRVGDRGDGGQAVGLRDAVGEVDEHDHVTELLGVRGPVVRRHDHVADVLRGAVDGTDRQFRVEPVGERTASIRLPIERS